MNRVLIVSNGPVPIMSGFKIEGSGQRSWGLATGLEQNGQQATVAVRDHYKVSEDARSDKIPLVNWSAGKSLISLANRFDVVIISYSMGKIAAELSKKINPSVSLVLDCYVPIYVELSARKSNNQELALSNYLVDHGYFNSALKRGDYFLCANTAQRHFYTGVLSALGILNPHSYRQDRIIELPFGINSDQNTSKLNPYKKLGVPEGEFNLLWFGGLYPWFDITELLDSILGLRKSDVSISLIIVGGKNPYNQNQEFISQYEEAVIFCKKNGMFNNGVYFVDWVDYDNRIDWYGHASAVININSSGKENEYSWRTRLMDFIWGEVPLITNGGDPISDYLVEHRAAIRIEETGKEYLTKLLSQLAVNGAESLSFAKDNLRKLREDFYWESLVKPLIAAIEYDPNPYLRERKFEKSIAIRSRKAKLSSNKLGTGAQRIKNTIVKVARNNNKQEKP